MNPLQPVAVLFPMYQKVRIALALSALAVLFACGEELVGEEIGCEWFEGSNCWKSSLEALGPCTHPEDQPCQLNTAGTRCDFQDGARIDFATPVNTSGTGQAGWEQVWNFTIVTGGQECMSFEEAPGQMHKLTTSEGTYTEQLINVGIQITCPSGERFKVVVASSLAYCENARDILPGMYYSTDEQNASISFYFNGGTEGKVHVFTAILP